MSSVKDSILLKGTSAGGSAVATDLKLHWDTTQTSLSGSTGVLTALAGSATGDMIDPSDVNKSDASSVDALGNQGWKYQDGGSSNTQLLANQGFNTINEGYFGINIHRSNPYDKSYLVEKWSAGCQVFQSVKDYDEFLDICKESAKLYGNSFTYTLLTEQEIRKHLQN